MNDYDLKFAREVGKRLAEIAREQQREKEYRASQQAAQQSVHLTGGTVAPVELNPETELVAPADMVLTASR